MRKTGNLLKALVLLLLIVSMLTGFVSSARAVVPYDRLKKEAMIESFREMFARGEFAKLDKGMNQVQRDFEKGEWSQYNLRNFFSDPFPRDPAFEDLFNKWVEAYPKSYAAHQNRGRFYYYRAVKNNDTDSKDVSPEQAAEAKKDLDAAVQSYLKAIKLTDKPVLSYADLMMLYFQTGSFEKSRDILDQARKKVPESALVRSQYLQALGESGEHRDLMREIVAEARKSPITPVELVNVVGIYDYWLLKEGRYEELDEDANRAQQDYEDGKITDVEIRNFFCKIVCTSSPAFEEKYDAWVKKFPRSYAARYARSMYLYKLAWKARGTMLIKDTTKAEVSGMTFYMQQALEDATAAVSLTEKPILAYKTLLEIARTSGFQQSYVDQLLERANRVDPDNFVVRYEYLYSLQERWGGSLQEMVDYTKAVRATGMPEFQLTWFEDLILEEKYWIQHYASEKLEQFGQVQTGF